MDELQTIKNETLKSAKIRNTSNNIDHGTVNSLQTKIKLLENENKLLKDDIKNKQKLIDSILEHNSNLIQSQNVLQTTFFEMIKGMSQTFQRMTD